MRFGFHVSMAGGFGNVRERADEVGCRTMQLFSSNPRGWKAAPLKEDDVAKFRADMKGADISPVFVHAPYLPNLAAAQAADARRSVAALVEQAARCAALGVNYLVAHVGKALGAPEEKALAQVAKNVDAVLAKSPRSVTLLLENTAGMGSEVGHSFAQKTRDTSLLS